ncbi:hypothetical protein [Cryobacterium sp. TMB1-7]|uniref:alginate O-acetyltransferase AlgX-related protein n=1 Tax=Cryobacterium sp. TMB1-7 TaxID=2555866 RepID=UPI00106B1EF2|nr:hypothetical protein [Cryobacterium sp. TMB1-7]TFC59910.1 hypothetical protein E3O60_07435 [Cryobacterium sp. TMB1-7]
MTTDNITPDDDPGTLNGWRRWALGAIIGTFSLGLLAIWLIPGDTAGAQNRESVAFPSLTPEGLTDRATFEGIDAALRDRLGAQVSVSAALGQMTVHLLGRSPTSSVIIGSDGQPYYTVDLTLPCRETEESLSTVKDGLAADYDAMTAAGKYVLFMVAPNKTDILRPAVDDVDPNLMRCSDFVRGHFDAWEAKGNLPLVTLWEDVAALDTEAAPTYLWNDTHWTTSGSMALSHALMNRLVDDNQAPASILDDLSNPVATVPVRYVGDLSRLMGMDDVDYITTASFERPGVTTALKTTMGSGGTPLYHYTSTSDSRPLVTGKTLFIGDSFLLSQIPTQLSNFFEDVTMADMAESAQAGDYDRVIAVRVERFIGTDMWPSFTEVLMH